MIGTVLIALIAASTPAGTSGEGAPLQCDIGPTTTRIAGQDWLVYACADGRSVVVVAGAPNPATPFVFIVRPEGEAIVLHGEGNAPRSATEPAYRVLKEMRATELSALYQQAEAAKP